MNLTLNCILRCASGAAGDINPMTASTLPIRSSALRWPSRLLRLRFRAIRSTPVWWVRLPSESSWLFAELYRRAILIVSPDWVQDFFARPVSAPGLPGLVHVGFMDALNSLIAGVVSAVKALKPGPESRLRHGSQQGRRHSPTCGLSFTADLGNSRPADDHLRRAEVGKSRFRNRLSTSLQKPSAVRKL